MEEFNENSDAQEGQDDYESNPSLEEDSSDTGTDETDTRDEEVERLKKELEETRRDKNGLIAKLNAKERSTKSSTPSNTSPVEVERLDKLELRMLDKDLTSEQIQEILLIKKAKGLSDVSEAYNNSLIQTWLKQTREESGRDDKIRKATPKAQRNMTSQPQEKKANGIRYNKDWIQEIPSDNTRSVAQMLEESILADE